MSVGFTRPQAAWPFRNWGGSSSNAATLTIDATEGETTVVSSTLVGKTILLVARTGSIYKKTTGTPTYREFSFDSSTGTITFGFAFNSNEDVVVNYK